MIALGIETSCDDTSVAIVDNKCRIISNIISSQINIHRKFGGIVPEIASRCHAKIIDQTIEKALNKAGLKLKDLDLIAATAGPGLIGGLIVGLMSGKTIASIYKKPFIAVNHLEAHALTCRLTNQINFPYLLLLLSGGHCQIILVNKINQYQKIGQTLDDALGEAFDKVARMLGLPYPGGPIIEKMALSGDKNRFILPRPLLRDKKNRYNFSFSGLKTAARILIEKIINSSNKKELNQKDICDICASFQKTILEILLDRLSNVIEDSKEKKINKVVISGGVAANRFLYQNIKETIFRKFNIDVLSPPIELCTDNAAMVAWTGIEKYQTNLINSLDFKPRARWDFTQVSIKL